MKVNSSDEPKVREAAALLNERITTYKTRFQIVDKQDLLTMVAFDAVFETLSQQEQQSQMVASISDELEKLVQQIG